MLYNLDSGKLMKSVNYDTFSAIKWQIYTRNITDVTLGQDYCIYDSHKPISC